MHRRSDAAALLLRWIVPGLVAILAAAAALDLLSFALAYDGVRGKDAPLHLTNSFKILHCGAHWSRVLEVYRGSWGMVHYGPAPYLLSAAATRLARINPLAGIYASRAAWLLFLVAALFEAGRRMGGSAWAGLSAAVAGGLNVAVLTWARAIDLEFPTMAAIALAAWGLAASRDFQSPRGSLGLGLACGLAALVKPAAAFYLAPLLVFVFLLPGERAARWSRRRLRNALVVVATAAVVALPFYGPLLGDTARDVTRQLAPYPERMARHLVVLALAVREQLPPPLVILFAAAGAVLGTRRRDGLALGVLASAAVAFVAFSMVWTPDERYLYPLQVLAALLVARLAWYRPRLAPTAAALFAVAYVWPWWALDPLFARSTLAPWGRGDPRLAARFVYGGQYPRGRTPFEEGLGSNASWERLWTIHRLLDLRYPLSPDEQIGIVDPAGGCSVAAEGAIALAHARDGWAHRIERLRQIYTPDFMDVIRVPQQSPAARRPLVLFLDPAARRLNDAGTSADGAAFRELLDRTHAVDFFLPADPSAPGRCAVAVYLARDGFQGTRDRLRAASRM